VKRFGVFVIAATCGSTLFAWPAAALPSKREQNCIIALNRVAARLATAQGRASAACITDASKGLLAGMDAQSCLSADRQGEIGRLSLKLTRLDLEKCASNVPDFGYTGAAASGSAALGEQLALVASVFGAPLDAAIAPMATNPEAARCQIATGRGYELVARTRYREFLACKKAGLKGGLIEDELALEACIVADPDQKILRAQQDFAASLVKNCQGQALASLFPSDCVADAGDPSAMASCISRRTDCHTCVAINDMDHLFHDCDLQDNGTVDGSCRSCGNGFVEDPETCDPPGETASCDGDCTPVSCGDGYANHTAGELCDDGNAVEGDGCDSNCTATACGNGILTSNEQCDDGNNSSGDGCAGDCSCEPGSVVIGCQDPICPDRMLQTVYAGTGRTCDTNSDCAVGSCFPSLGRCLSETSDDVGYSGLVHDVDTSDEFPIGLKLACVGPGPVCGECVVRGVDPGTGSCRCAGDSQSICDEPFAADVDDCGGATCLCYEGPPEPAVQGGTPVCLLWRYNDDVSGTVNVDTGTTELLKDISTVVHLGETLTIPCPVCGGSCVAPLANAGTPCIANADCDESPGDGVCSDYDTTAGDGLRDGTCVLGANAGEPCDVQGFHRSFPNPGGGGHSLDCMPLDAKNISGPGTQLSMRQTTSFVSLDSAVPCGVGDLELCPCGLCADNPSVACASNADCPGQSACTAVAPTVPKPNGCLDGLCTDGGAGEGACLGGPEFGFCDGVIRANGEPFVSCTDNSDCAQSDCGAVSCGLCTLNRPLDCFLPQIEATGVSDPLAPLQVAVACMPQVNPGVDYIVGLPGPGRFARRSSVEYACASDPGTAYVPGVGGCP
jgi:cysteine-rich repeat protein